MSQAFPSGAFQALEDISCSDRVLDHTHLLYLELLCVSADNHVTLYYTHYRILRYSPFLWHFT